MSSKKVTYIKKVVNFQGQQLVIFSIDGATWSSRKDELLAIIERHEQERQNFGGQIKGGPQAKSATSAKNDASNAKASKSQVVSPAEITSTMQKSEAKNAGSQAKAKKAAQPKPTKARSSSPKVPNKSKSAIKAKGKSKTKLPEPKKRAAATNKARKSSKSKRKAA